jgi:hypothetical protein
MTNGRSPGSDGYTVDFYKYFWEDIGPLLYRSLYLAYGRSKRPVLLCCSR